jgi:mannose-6-phosphate isomerase-like protein (cupin superfamily)
MIAEPAAWRRSLARAPEPDPGRNEHAHLISRGLPPDLDGATVRALDAAARLRWDRAERHEHNVPELNVILPGSALTCEIVLGDERYDVEGAASLVVPAGLPHSIEAKGGSGFLVSVALGPR